MLPSQLYNVLIEEERKGLNKKTLRNAIRKVTSAYNQEALRTGDTYLDYGKPEYRCAYLYKYASTHTLLVSKFFRKLVKKKSIRKVLTSKKEIKIKCLGGGPGTDVVGVFKALALLPYMHKKVSEATVLDVSLGWHYSFNYIIQKLITGEMKDIPETFVKKNFKANFLEVNLLETLPIHVIESISNADIICMVKFVSAILGKEDSLKALKVIAGLFKKGCIILFLDNFNDALSNSIQGIAQEAGLQIVLGPEVERFQMGTNVKKIHPNFHCVPMRNGRVKIMGLIKMKERSFIDSVIPIQSETQSTNNKKKKERRGTSSAPSPSNELLIKNSDQDKKVCDKFTQTEDNGYDFDIKELIELSNALSHLLTITKKYNIKNLPFT